MITTDRLNIRHFRKSDFEGFSELTIGSKVEKTKVESVFKKQILKNKNYFAILMKDTNKIIGLVNLFDSEAFSVYNPYKYKNFPSRSISVKTHMSYRGQGYMTEAVKAVLKHTFNETPTGAVYARVLTTNQASLALFDKCGFELIKRELQYVDRETKKFVATVGITRESCRKNPNYQNFTYEKK